MRHNWHPESHRDNKLNRSGSGTHLLATASRKDWSLIKSFAEARVDADGSRLVSSTLFQWSAEGEMIVIIDYKMGNVGSILNMMKRIGNDAVISADPDVIAQATKIVLPGVGAFDEGMGNLKAGGLSEVLHDKVIADRTPTLGICLGMQLLGDRSEEGTLPGLGWIHGEMKRFVFDGEHLKVPHMGWNTVVPAKPSAMSYLDGPDTRFYFVHAYHFVCADPTDALFTSEYGHSFVSAVKRGNIMGVQFHPEKSHRFGMELLRTFAGMRNSDD